MPDKKKTYELADEDLEKVLGGTASVSGWSSYKGKCECNQWFEVSNKKITGTRYTCSCGRSYELRDGSVYCNSVQLPLDSYVVTDHDS